MGGRWGVCSGHVEEWGSVGGRGVLELLVVV